MSVVSRSPDAHQPRPRTITFFPTYRSNPFLSMMALAPLADGATIQGVMTFDDLLAAFRGADRGDVVHIHWTTPIVQHSDSETEALSRVSALEREIQSLQGRGGYALWTVHNRLPHERRHEGAEKMLMRMLASNADLIHTMAAATAKILSDIVALDSNRVLRLPHPSYAGVYPDPLDRLSARESFSLTQADFAVLFVGQMRPYKGLDDLLNAATGQPIAAGRRLVLMLAGDAFPEVAAHIEALLPAQVRSIVTYRALPEHELSRWYRAADLVVLPYREVLNSGSLHLAATFGTPSVLPGLMHLRDEFGSEPWVQFFDPDDAVASLRALLAEPGVRPPDESYWPFLDARSPWRFSRAYADAISALDDREVTPSAVRGFAG